MKVEYNENGARSVRNRKRKRKFKSIFVALTAIILVVAVTVVLMLTVFFNVNEVKVVGSSVYTKDQIVFASGIMDGDNLIRLSTEEIEQRIEESLPYVKDAVVKKALPDTVGIEITPAKEVYLIENADGYFVCDQDYKVLRQTAERPEELLRVKGIATEKPDLGKLINFTNKQQRDVLSELQSICSDKGFDVTFINIESMVDISFAIDDRIYIKLGSYTDLASKLIHLESTLEKVDDNVMVSISLEGWSLKNKEAVLKYHDITQFLK